MKRDPIVLGENYILTGDDIGYERPNDNQLIVGCSGTGKSTSIAFPTMVRMNNSNPIASYAKAADAYKMASYQETKGYTVEILDIASPERGNVSFDPINYLCSNEDIDTLSSTIVYSVLKKTNDDYWNAKAKQLLGSLIETSLMINENPRFSDVLALFDKLQITESGSGVTTSLDYLFEQIETSKPNSYAVREFKNVRSLPFKTFSCIRDSLAAALSTMFPESIRTMMNEKKAIDFEKLGTKKIALFVVTSAVDTWQAYYANLFYRTCIKELLRFAQECPNHQLLRPVRLILEDFSCTTPIEGFEHDISLMREAGLSAMIFLQSETQLENMYTSEKAAIIRQNCPVYVYFPGGFDDRSCELVAKKMNMSFQDILFAPLGKIFVMQSGKNPTCISRYDTLNSKEYKHFLHILEIKKENKRTIKERM